MPQPPPLPRPLSLAPFHVSEARGFGVPPARLRRADLTTPFRGVRSPAPLSSVPDRCLAYLPLLAADQGFSHATAGVLWGMWIPVRLQDSHVVHVTSTGASREPRMIGVRGHRAAPGSLNLTMAGGLPLVTPLDTWRQLAADLTVDELVEVGDSLVRRQGALEAMPDLAVVLTGHRGTRGMARLRRALPNVRAGADSPRETKLRLLLTRTGLPEPSVNLEISEPGSVRRIFGDLVYSDHKVVVEYDGEQHRLDSRQYAADVARLEALASAGWLVIRVLAADLRRPDLVARRVARALAGRGWRPTPSRLHLLR